MLESLLRRVEELERRLNNVVREGRVTQVDPIKGVKLSLDDGPNGVVESPWMKPADDDGVLKGWNPKRVGQWMKVISPNGEIGAASIAIPHSHNDSGGGAPSQDLSEPMLKVGGTELRLKDGVATLSAKKIALKGGVEISGTVTANGVDIGDQHRHRDTMAGPGLSGPPQT